MKERKQRIFWVSLFDMLGLRIIFGFIILVLFIGVIYKNVFTILAGLGVIAILAIFEYQIDKEMEEYVK